MCIYKISEIIDFILIAHKFMFIFYKRIIYNFIIKCRHGEPWREFRSRVQKPVLQLSTVRRYVEPLEEVTNYFIQRCEEMLDKNSELPDDFDNEIHKWSLECKPFNLFVFYFELLKKLRNITKPFFFSCFFKQQALVALH